jgi:hypothetical protein
MSHDQALSRRPKRKLNSSEINNKEVVIVNAATILNKFGEALLPWQLMSDFVWNNQSIKYLPDSYKSSEEYRSFWEPLLVEETKASVLDNIINLRKFQTFSFQMRNIDLNTPLGIHKVDCFNIIKD